MRCCCPSSLGSPTVDTLERLLKTCGMELEPIDRPDASDLDWTLIDHLLDMPSAQRARYVAATGREIGRLRRTARVVT